MLVEVVIRRGLWKPTARFWVRGRSGLLGLNLGTEGADTRFEVSAYVIGT